MWYVCYEAVPVQARAKALREHQRARLDARHKYVLGLVANRLDLEESAVEDFMLDGDQVAWRLYQHLYSSLGEGFCTSVASASLVPSLVPRPPHTNICRLQFQC